MHKRVVVTMAAGAALTVSLTSCAGGKEAPEVTPPTENPPPPEPPVISDNPPPPEAPALPTWAESLSGHPEGATNPPYPMLVVTPDGAHCYKQWVSPMMGKGGGPLPTDRVDACTPTAEDATPCGNEIACPPEAQEILAGRPTNPDRTAPK